MLTTFPLESPAYEALSYTWGDTKPTETILINSEEFKVTDNLESALFSLRKESEPVIIWIDAVSIDQSDADEKSWQVAQMGDVYRQATQVLVWLGIALDDSGLAMDAIAMISPCAVKVSETYKDDLEHIAQKCLESHPSKLENLDKYSPERLYQRLIGNLDQNWQFPLSAMAALIRRPWWRRTWVLQELVLARHVMFFCGKKQVEENHFMGAWSALALLERTIYRILYVTMEEVSDYELSFPEAMRDDSAREILRYRR
jgi:heterokaryon incompatibility protein (HET)